MAKKIKTLKRKEESYTKKEKRVRKTVKKVNKRMIRTKETLKDDTNENNENTIKELCEKNSSNNDLKIELYPDRKVIDDLEEISLSELYDGKFISSLEDNRKLAYLDSNVPVLQGFYTAHTNHYPIRIKPDDIWLLIIQAFGIHVNNNYKELRKYFVNFEGKKELVVEYPNITSFEQIDKKIFENFSEQINKQLELYLSKEMIDLLTPDFTTTTNDSLITCKISIMGIFEKYFEYKMKKCICGIPYIILEGTAEDYKKIKSKAKELSKFEFKWYINRIMPHVEKMINAKEGNININYFKKIVQKEDKIVLIPHCGRPKKREEEFIYGWILNFFAYLKKVDKEGKNKIFSDDSISVTKFDSFVSQMMRVPFRLNDNIFMQFNAGFIGCGKNEKKEIFPVQGWIVFKNDEDF